MPTTSMQQQGQGRLQGDRVTNTADCNASSRYRRLQTEKRPVIRVLPIICNHWYCHRKLSVSVSCGTALLLQKRLSHWFMRYDFRQRAEQVSSNNALFTNHHYRIQQTFKYKRQLLFKLQLIYFQRIDDSQACPRAFVGQTHLATNKYIFEN